MKGFARKGDDIQVMLCPICKSAVAKKNMELMQCRTCDHMFVENLYDDKYWQDLYENKYTKSDRKFDAQRNAMYVQEIHWINKYKELAGSFLDVGCSYGNFLMFLPSEMRKVGIEVSGNVIKEAMRLHPNYEFHNVELCKYEPKDKFDFIQFRGVLQHTTDPVSNLKCAIKLLEKNGIIIVTSLPDFSSITSKFYKEKFRFYVPQLAPNYFTKKSFAYMLKSLGLKIKIKHSPYFKTPYSNFPKDLANFLINKYTNKPNPPFYGNLKNYIIERE